MPIYDYQCEQCAHVFEKRHSMMDDCPVPCPVCEGTTYRIISAPASILNWKRSEYVHNSTRLRPRAENPVLGRQA